MYVSVRVSGPYMAEGITALRYGNTGSRSPEISAVTLDFDHSVAQERNETTAALPKGSGAPAGSGPSGMGRATGR